MPVAVPHPPSSRHDLAARRRRRPADAHHEAEQRRQALVGAAERVFLKKGYHAATMDDIAAAASMSKRTLYQLISSKEQLFSLLLERHRPRITVTIDESGAAPDAMLFEILLPWARYILAPPSVSLLRLIIADHQRGKTLARLLDRSSAKLCRSLLEEYLGALVAKGTLVLADPEEASQMLFGMAIGNIHFGMLIGLRGAPSRDEVEARLRRAIDIFLLGAMPRA
jgi:TetR/AcrR family transcriptional repressor of mexJK operon